MDNKNNNLSLGADAWKGTDIEKGIHQDHLEKKLEKGFSETPEPKEGEAKNVQPTVEEIHADESKTKDLQREAAQKLDKKHTYDKLDNEGKRALRVLVNIEGKSAKDKIDAVIDHFGVSKVGAINLLADATKDMTKKNPPSTDGEEVEKSIDYKKRIEDMNKRRDPDGIEKKERFLTFADLDKGIEEEICKAFGIDGDYLEKGKALPIGTINKYGEIKTSEGWKHIKKGERTEHHDSAINHAKTSNSHVTPDHDSHPNKMGAVALDEKTGKEVKGPHTKMMEKKAKQAEFDKKTLQEQSLPGSQAHNEMLAEKKAKKESTDEMDLKKKDDSGNKIPENQRSRTSDGTIVKIGDSVTIERNLTTDPKNKQGETGKIVDIGGRDDDDTIFVEFSDGTRGEYDAETFSKSKGDEKEVKKKKIQETVDKVTSEASDGYQNSEKAAISITDIYESYDGAPPVERVREEMNAIKKDGIDRESFEKDLRDMEWEDGEWDEVKECLDEVFPKR